MSGWRSSCGTPKRGSTRRAAARCGRCAQVATETAATVIAAADRCAAGAGAAGTRGRRGAGRARRRLRGGSRMAEPASSSEPRNWVRSPSSCSSCCSAASCGRRWPACWTTAPPRSGAELEEAARLRQEAEAMLREAEARRADGVARGEGADRGRQGRGGTGRRGRGGGGGAAAQPARADGDGPHRRCREGCGGRGAARPPPRWPRSRRAQVIAEGLSPRLTRG